MIADQHHIEAESFRTQRPLDQLARFRADELQPKSKTPRHRPTLQARRIWCPGSANQSAFWALDARQRSTMQGRHNTNVNDHPTWTVESRNTRRTLDAAVERLRDESDKQRCRISGAVGNVLHHSFELMLITQHHHGILAFFHILVRFEPNSLQSNAAGSKLCVRSEPCRLDGMPPHPLP